MPYAPDRFVCAFGSATLLKHLEAIQKELEGVKAAEDIEYIHRMRVATRRFRNALDIFSGCLPQKKHVLWQRQIRLITRALGAARDTDVQIDHIANILENTEDKKLKPGLNRLILRLRQKRQKLQRNVLTALEKLLQSGVLDNIMRSTQKKLLPEEPGRPHSAALYVLSNDVIQARLGALLAYETYIYTPECKKELHAMRIEAKRLRYSLETFASLYPGNLEEYIVRTRKMQELLGEIHDRDVWLEFLPQFLEAERARTQKYYGNQRIMLKIVPGIQHLERLEQTLRDDLYHQFLSTWAKWKTSHLWESLREEISVHIPPQEIYPPALPPAAS
ncbi:MAG: CHAD domain-containing protein [Anaerolineae bacterium]|nr:CHAD domain-containing protein [Anaerolineae bacterium]